MPHRSSHTSPALRVYILALVLRLFNAVLSRAFFQPDEYWQALEPAHRWVWGFGWATWEWRVQPRDGAQDASSWRELVLQGGRGGIRSPLAVLPTAVAYAVLKLMGCESPAILVRSSSFCASPKTSRNAPLQSLAPRLVQACIAATTDLAVSRLATRILGPAFANAAVRSSLCTCTGPAMLTHAPAPALRLALVLLQPAHGHPDPEQLDRDGAYSFGVGVLAVGVARRASASSGRRS